MAGTFCVLVHCLIEHNTLVYPFLGRGNFERLRSPTLEAYPLCNMPPDFAQAQEYLSFVFELLLHV